MLSLFCAVDQWIFFLFALKYPRWSLAPSPSEVFGFWCMKRVKVVWQNAPPRRPFFYPTGPPSRPSLRISWHRCQVSGFLKELQGDSGSMALVDFGGRSAANFEVPTKEAKRKQKQKHCKTVKTHCAPLSHLFFCNRNACAVGAYAWESWFSSRPDLVPETYKVV